MHIGYTGNNVEHRRDQSWFDFFQAISFRVFSEISCVLTILYGTSVAVDCIALNVWGKHKRKITIRGIN